MTRDNVRVRVCEVCEVCEENESDHWLELWDVFSHFENKKKPIIYMSLPATAFILVAIERKKKKNIVALLKQHNRKLYEKIEK